jgi:hypothetical protein
VWADWKVVPEQSLVDQLAAAWAAPTAGQWVALSAVSWAAPWVVPRAVQLVVSKAGP